MSAETWLAMDALLDGEVVAPRWPDGTPVVYNETKVLLEGEEMTCSSCRKPTRTVYIRDATVFGRQFRPVLLDEACAREWDETSL